MELEKLEQACLEAAVAGGKVVRGFQLKGTGEQAEVKHFDATLVTVADRRSEEAIVAKLRALLPDLPVLAEEGGLTGFDGGLDEYEERYFAMVDPLDGTFSFVVGAPTSTTAVGVYDRELRRVVASAVALPAVDTVWFSRSGRCLAVGYDANSKVGKPVTCQVWGGDLGHKVALFVDKNNFHVRKDLLSGKRYEVYSDAQIRDILARMAGIGKLAMYGSNAVHQALVANGGEYVGGSVGTAGGPWDHLGALLVKNAGGEVAGYRSRDGELQEVDALNAMAIDMLVTANSEATLAQLKRCVEEGMKA